MNVTLQLLTLLAAAVIFFKIEPALNRMSAACPVWLRIMYAVALVLSAGMVLMITQGYVPPLWLALLLMCGASALATRQIA
jgi:hypothetical protein